MTSIPASALVNVQPSVIDAGSSLLSLNGLFLTDSAYMPTNTVLSLPTLAAVKAYFGLESAEASAAAVYFKGNDGSLTKPSTMMFSVYSPAEHSANTAFLRGASLRGVKLSDLVALSGQFGITIDGVAIPLETISLSTAESFDDIATIIGTALSIDIQFNADLFCFFVYSGTAGASSTIAPAIGGLANELRLSLSFPVTLSQGTSGMTLAESIQIAATATQNFATFTTTFEPDADGKDALAEWADAQNYGYAYIAWDTDANALIEDADCLGVRLIANELSGTSPVYAPTEIEGLQLASFVMGTGASIDFAQANGRITFAYKGQTGLVASVTNKDDADALIANGYNFYGDYATKNQQFKLFQTGSIAGEWKWLDTFLNQIYMNSRIQSALLQLLALVGSLPYNTDGYGMLRVTIQQPAAEFINFGSIREGIPLDAEQASIVNQQAGVKIDDILSTAGWYLQILPATSQARSNRTTPPIKFWYTDGGSIQQISLDSINVL